MVKNQFDHKYNSINVIPLKLIGENDEENCKYRLTTTEFCPENCQINEQQLDQSNFEKIRDKVEFVDYNFYDDKNKISPQSFTQFDQFKLLQNF